MESTTSAWIVRGALAVMVTVAGAHRLSAALRRGRIPVGEAMASDGTGIFLLLRISGLLLWGSLFAYAVHPPVLDFAVVPVPAVLQWSAVPVVLALAPGLALWAARSIGGNVTKTAGVRPDHVLVTSGPYRWIRNPLYLAGTLEFIGIALLTGSLFVLGMTMLAFTGLLLRLPREEAALAERFGEAWHAYTETSGRFFPPVLARWPGRE